MTGLTLRQERALAITPKFTSTLSIPCSIFLIYEIYCDHKRGGTNSVQRVLLGMSIVDILASSAWFLSTWAVPEGSFAYAAGNQASCNFQGFLLQLAIGAPLYNCSLALFYTLMIKQRWTDYQLVRIERWVHGFIISFTVGTSILLLFLQQYNHVGAVCWVIGSPPDCGNSSFQGSDVPCERGDHAWAWGLALFYGPLWVCVVACCSSMMILYHEVRKTLARSRRYSRAMGAQDSLRRSGRDSSKVATQAILYSLTFLITWMPSTLWSIAHWFQWSHFALDIGAATAEPLQGFWNLLIFLRTRPKTIRKIRTFLSFIFPCCCSPPEEERDSNSRFSGLTQSVKNVIKAFGPLASAEIPLSQKIAEAEADSPAIETTSGLLLDDSSSCKRKGGTSAVQTPEESRQRVAEGFPKLVSPAANETMDLSEQPKICDESKELRLTESKQNCNSQPVQSMGAAEKTGATPADGQQEMRGPTQSEPSNSSLDENSSAKSLGLTSCLKTSSHHEANPKGRVQFTRKVSFEGSSSSESDANQSKVVSFDIWT